MVVGGVSGYYSWWWLSLRSFKPVGSLAFLGFLGSLESLKTLKTLKTLETLFKVLLHPRIEERLHLGNRLLDEGLLLLDGFYLLGKGLLFQ